MSDSRFHLHIHNIKKHFSDIPLAIKLPIFLVGITVLVFFFYVVPLANANTPASTGSNLSSHIKDNIYSTGNNNFNENTTSSSPDANENGTNADTSNKKGIGGGSIIGNCSAGKKDLPIYCVDKTNSEGKKYISLSFDAAWGDSDTIKILDILDKHNVKVTFFMTGGWVDAYPDKVKEIYSRGHDLGNHSQNHKQMSKLSVNEQKQELQSVTDKVKELTGYQMFLFRPPYGDYNSTLNKTAYSINYYPIQWSVDSLDWKDYGVDNIIKTVTEHKALDNGAIILCHNGAKFTADALDTMISTLEQKGFTFIPISQMIIRENFKMDANGQQLPANPS